MKLLMKKLTFTSKNLTIGLNLVALFLISFYSSSQQMLDTQKVQAYLNEVYRDCPQYATAEYVQINQNFLERIIIHSKDLTEYPECPKLSELSFKNKCNGDLTYDLSEFSAETFNPFKYHFPQQDRESRYFRVDNQPFIIEIKPKVNQ